MLLTKQELSSLLNKIKSVKVGFIGDICLDLYWRADMTKSRLSRETPHYPLPIVDETYTPGAGGNVICNLKALGIDNLQAVSVIGADWRGFLLAEAFEKYGIDISNLIRRSAGVTPCYCKPLRKGISDVVYEDPRLDFENYRPLSAEDEDKLLAALDTVASQVDILAVSDQFTYGVVTPRIRERLSAIAETIPVVVDSRDNLGAFKNVIVKPNELEASRAVGRESASYADIAAELQKRNGVPVIVTLGEEGALWCDNERCERVLAVKVQPPVDIVGAGDTFLSAFCAAFAACKDGTKAIQFANLASAVTVKKLGTTGTASPYEILAAWEASAK